LGLGDFSLGLVLLILFLLLHFLFLLFFFLDQRFFLSNLFGGLHLFLSGSLLGILFDLLSLRLSLPGFFLSLGGGLNSPILSLDCRLALFFGFAIVSLLLHFTEQSLDDGISGVISGSCSRIKAVLASLSIDHDSVRACRDFWLSWRVLYVCITLSEARQIIRVLKTTQTKMLMTKFP